MPDPFYPGPDRDREKQGPGGQSCRQYTQVEEKRLAVGPAGHRATDVLSPEDYLGIRGSSLHAGRHKPEKYGHECDEEAVGEGLPPGFPVRPLAEEGHGQNAARQQDAEGTFCQHRKPHAQPGQSVPQGGAQGATGSGEKAQKAEGHQHDEQAVHRPEMGKPEGMCGGNEEKAGPQAGADIEEQAAEEVEGEDRACQGGCGDPSSGEQAGPAGRSPARPEGEPEEQRRLFRIDFPVQDGDQVRVCQAHFASDFPVADLVRKLERPAAEPGKQHQEDIGDQQADEARLARTTRDRGVLPAPHAGVLSAFRMCGCCHGRDIAQADSGIQKERIPFRSITAGSFFSSWFFL